MFLSHCVSSNPDRYKKRFLIQLSFQYIFSLDLLIFHTLHCFWVVLVTGKFKMLIFIFSSFNLVLSPSYVSSVVDNLVRPFISEMNLLCILALPSLCQFFFFFSVLHQCWCVSYFYVSYFTIDCLVKYDTETLSMFVNLISNVYMKS